LIKDAYKVKEYKYGYGDGAMVKAGVLVCWMKRGEMKRRGEEMR